MNENDVLQGTTVSGNDEPIYTDTGVDDTFIDISGNDSVSDTVSDKQSVSGNNAEIPDGFLADEFSAESITESEVVTAYYPEDYVTSTQANALLFALIVFFLYIVLKDFFNCIHFGKGGGKDEK